jgi:fermentation-respiration switch protein FrsA (DUF1100 family)
MVRRSHVDRLFRRSWRAVFRAEVAGLPDTAEVAHGPAGCRLSTSRRAFSGNGGRREGHRLARAGKTGTRGCHLFSGQWRLSRRQRRPLSRHDRGRDRPRRSIVSRGYAGSSGEPGESGLLLDADAAYVFTAARYSADRIVVWGFSLGSGVAVALATERPVTKLILEAPLYLDCGRGGLAVSIRAGTLADQGSVSIRRAHSACHGPASDHAWRPRSNNSDPTGRAFVHARP